MRKILSLALILMLVLCLATTAFAAEPTFIEDPTVPTDVALEAGESIEYQVRAAGMTMTLTNAANLTVTIDGIPVTANGEGVISAVITVMGHPMFAPPTSIVITNETDAKIVSVLTFAYPEGSYNNPADMVIGANTADVPSDGYYFTYTATEDGVLIVTPAGDNWTVTINNETTYEYGDQVWASDEVGFAACGMSVGDVLTVIVGTEDWTEATISFTASIIEHITEKVDAAEAECHLAGNIEHYYCQYCDGYFADEAATEVLTEAEVYCYPALGSENVIHNAEIPASCHEDGVMEHWICEDCGKYFEDEECTIETDEWSLGLGAYGAMEVEHIEANEPGCHSIGNIEYWICVECGGYFEDDWCWFGIEPELVIIPATGSENVQHTEAADPTCHDRGNVEYWFCPDCERFFLDEACTQLTNALSIWLGELGSENVTHMEAVAPNCHFEGNVEYWHCADCDRYFLDEACTQLTNYLSTVAPATGSENVKHVEEVAPVCHKNGMQEHWYCEDCGTYFLDEACTQIVMMPRFLVIPSEITMEYHEAVAPTCTEKGMQEYWYCAECDCYFTDAEGKYNIARLSLVIDADGVSHDLEHHAAADPVCHKNGNVEYWYCAKCDCYFVKVDGNLVNTNAKNVVVLAEATLEHSEKTDATCTENGMQEYWYCAECDCYFTDAEGKYNIARLSLVIAAPGHNYVDGVCTECNDNPNTSDMSIVLPILGVLMSSGATVAMLKKKEF